MRFGRQFLAFQPPSSYPDLTELQVGMLKRIHHESSMTQALYHGLFREQVEPLPAGVPLSREGHQQALAMVQQIAVFQRRIALTGPLFLPGLPDELSPRGALIQLQRIAYACVALAAPDVLPATVLGRESVTPGDPHHLIEQYHNLSWFRTVSAFPAVSDTRIGELLASADLSTYGRTAS